MKHQPNFSQTGTISATLTWRVTTDLVIIEGVYQSDKPPGLCLSAEGHCRDVTQDNCVKLLADGQVVRCSHWLETDEREAWKHMATDHQYAYV